MERELLARTGVTFTAIPAAGVHGVGLRRLPGNLMQLARGYRASRRVLRDFRPHVLFFTGGYVAGPMGMAARGKTPMALYVPDIEPGLALKFLARMATRIFVTVEETRAFFPKKEVQVVGYPVRKEILAWTREKARQTLHLPEDARVLLVFGGSLGARSINQALLEALPRLLPHMYVVHVSGNRDWPMVEERLAQLPARWREHYRPYPYLHETMGAALAAADLVVSRAGASTLGEFPAWGLPAVLVPYPYAWRYQKVNAMYLVERGAAVLLPDESLAQRLAGTVLDLMQDISRRQAMGNAMRALFRPQAAQAMARGLLALAQKGGRTP